MLLQRREQARRGAVTGKTIALYSILWLVGIPGFILALLFIFGVGH